MKNTDLFYKHICDYVVGNITTEQLPVAALECITAGMEGENLNILADLSDSSDIIRYYKLTLDELKIQEPDKENAAKYLIHYYCNELLENKITPAIFMRNIVFNIDNQVDIRKDKKYAGDYFGIEKIIGLFWGLDDVAGLEYTYIEDYMKYNKDVEKIVYEECYKEAKEILRRAPAD